MSLWRQIAHGMRALLRRSAADRDVDDEVRHYLERATAEHLARGLSLPEARRAAQLELGGETRVRDEVRAYGWENVVDAVFQDLRYATRALRRNPVFACVSVGILVIGIGATTSVFQLVDALLLQPPPVDAPQELKEIWNANPRASTDFERYAPLSYPEYAYFRDHHDAFTGVLALDGDPTFLSWKRGRRGELVQAQFVSANFFSVLRVNAATGRMLVPGDDAPSGGAPVAVVSHLFWRQRLNADPDLAHIPFVVNGQSFTIVGVAAEDFSGLVAGLTPDVWLPLSTVERVRHESGTLASRNSFWLISVGRLKPGASAEQAGAELAVQGRQFANGDPELKDQVTSVFPATLVPGPVRGYVAVFVGLLQLVVVLMLVIACANAANLALAQAASRRPEMAVRASLGASRGRLLQQMLTETMILAGMAGAGGLLAAHVLTPMLLRLIPPTLPLRLSVSTDWRVVTFTAALALVSGIALGWAPALRATSDLMLALKGEAAGGRRQSKLRSALVVTQVAVSLVLLVAGALCWRSLAHAKAIDPGFATDHRVFVKLDLKSLGYSDSAGQAFYRMLLDRVAAEPGVTSASTASYLPLESTTLTVGINVAGRVPPAHDNGWVVQAIDVGPAYFATVGTPVLRGREFDTRDAPGAAPVVVVNQAMAERFWPGEPVVGRTFTIGAGKEAQEVQIVGVVPTGKYRTLGEQPRPVIYRSLLQHYHPRSVLLAHMSAPAATAISALRDEVAAIDPNLVVIQADALDEQLSLARFPTRVTGILFTAIGLTGLCLALAGLAGLVAYSVARRTREIGIRMALGARRGAVVGHFVREGGRLLLIGIGIGSVIAIAATRLLSGVLFGTSATDPLTALRSE